MRASRVNPTCVDPGATRRDVSTVHRLCRETPGSRRFAPASPSLVRDTRVGGARSRGARSEPLAVVVFTMSNSVRFFVPAARCCAQVCDLLRIRLRLRRRAHGGFGAGGRCDGSNSVPPMRGGWSADRRTLSFGRACDARPPCPGATGTSLGAPPWRFSDADPRSRLPAVEPEPAATFRARPYDWRSGSGPPCGAVRAASAGRHSWLRLAGSFLENAPSEPGCKSCTINSLRSQ